MVEVEVDMANGFPQVVLVGLPDAVVRQSVDRVRAAVVNAGATFPQRRITIGLSPASMPKQGSGFDLALAAAGPPAARGGAPRAGGPAGGPRGARLAGGVAGRPRGAPGGPGGGR